MNKDGMDWKVNNAKVALMLLGVLIIVAMAYFAQGAPSGASVTNISHDTGPTFTPGNRSDDGGTINVITLNSNQQNTGWKAYVGNVSGTLTLDDASQNTIYNWSLSSISGELYVTRDSNADWSTVTCASGGTITTEQTFIGGASTDDDSINNTYSQTAHPTMQVGGSQITNSSCRTIYTFQNDDAQSASESANFTAILLEDSDSSLVYATFLEQNDEGFDSSIYDFQIIVPDQNNASVATYYFYLELGG